MPDALPSAERTNSATIEGLLLYEAGQRDGEVLATKRIVAWLRKEGAFEQRAKRRQRGRAWDEVIRWVATAIERGEHEESGDGR